MTVISSLSPGPIQSPPLGNEKDVTQGIEVFLTFLSGLGVHFALKTPNHPFLMLPAPLVAILNARLLFGLTFLLVALTAGLL